MHENNIESIRREAIRLAEFQTILMEEMQEKEGIITESETKSLQTFDRKSLPQAIEILRSEISKLSTLDMVLAIVGTMKAGKSTTINAIVGMEVLPSRNEPMTALPTFIRHKSGQSEPRLILEHNAALQEFVDKVHGKIKAGLPHSEAAQNDRGFTRLFESFKTNQIIEKEYVGAENIFKFLTTINDLVRFSREFDLEFPYFAYRDIGELPVIEVEFSHLHGKQGDQGTLTLLDTPGPNEAGQMYLKEMLADQLGKASAVLSVMDYQQLKSEADAHIKQELESIAEVVRDRLFVMVNKFDQKGHHDMDRNQICNYVSSSMMDGLIDKENVFPVSSRQAYLANCARRALASSTSLPSPEEEGWVTDFCKSAIDPMWEPTDPIKEDTTALKTRAERLWKKSGFEAPLNAVIRKAHAQSSLMLLGSAAKKLTEGATKIHNLLEARESGLQKSTKDLENTIAAIGNDIHKTESAENAAEEKSAELLSEIQKSLSHIFNQAEKESLKELDEYFNTGKNALNETNNTDKKSTKSDERKGTISQVKKSKIKLDFDPKYRRLEFVKKEDANEQIKKIKEFLSSIVDKMNDSIHIKIDTYLSRFQSEFNDVIIGDIKEILGNLLDHLSKDGLILEIELPEADLGFDFDAKKLIGSVESRNEKRQFSKLFDKQGTISRVARWFGEKLEDFYENEWGREMKSVESPVWIVDFDEISSELKKTFKETISPHSKLISDEIQNRLNDKRSKFFKNFKNQVSSIRGDLMQSQKDQSRNKESQDELLEAFRKFKKKARDCKTDGEKLSAEVNIIEKQVTHYEH